MQSLTPEKQELIVQSLKSKFESVAGVSNVLVKNPLLDSKHDVIELLTIENIDQELEVKYIYLSFKGFEDSKTDGCDDNPVVYLTYNAHVVWGYKERRSDNGFSEADFTNLIINIRAKFLNKTREILENCESLPVTQKQDIVLDDDPLTGAYSYFVDLTVKVEVS